MATTASAPRARQTKRRTYTTGYHCTDCGHTHKPTTEVIFWLNGMRARFCSTCVRAYRSVILKP